MEKIKLKESSLNRSAQITLINLNNIVNILPKKDEILFSQKTFMEIILGLIKETINEYLTKKKLSGIKNEIILIKESLLKLMNNLKEIKEEKEKKIKLYKIQKYQKESNLQGLMININNKRRRRVNSENLSMSVLNYDDSDEFNFGNFTKDEQDFKTKNFILENRISEIENNINRMKFLIKFNKLPHKFGDHFIEYLIEDKKNKQKIIDNLHSRLVNVRSAWKNVANKKNLQDMRLENIRTRIKYIKKESENGTKKDKKYINTEDIIPEENHGTENFREEKKINKKKESKDVKIKLKNVNMNDTNDNKIKLDMSDLEKLLLLNINVNINLNQQYINNHYNNFNQNQQNEKLEKDL